MKGATIHDVARAADVSVATVSRTLNGPESVAAATRERVLRAVGELDYVPNSGARALSSRCTDTIGVLLPDLHGEFFSELIRGIDLAARERGLHLLLSSFHGDLKEAASALRSMRSRVDAKIVMLPDRGDAARSAISVGSPTVFLGADGGPGSLSLLIDNHAGAFAMSQHLLGLGRRRIAFISGPGGNYEARERERGYRDALAAAGLEPLIVAGDFSEEAGRTAAGRLLQGQRPDAIFCANDMMALGCLDALRSAGLVVPDDVALAGFDDIPIARYVSPPLTTAAVPIAEIGRQALLSCVELFAGRKPTGERLFEPRIVIRASTSSNAILLRGVGT